MSSAHVNKWAAPVNYWAAPPPVVHTKAFHRSSNTPLVVVEVDDGVDAARAGQQGEADHDGDLPGVGVNRTLRPRLNLNRC